MTDNLQKIDENATDEVIEMAICEVPFLMLRPGVLYRFVEMPGCDACAAAAAPSWALATCKNYAAMPL